MRKNEIWVVVATGTDGAKILANREGSSSVVARFAMPQRAAGDADRKVVSIVNLRRPTATLAREIMAHLVEGAIQGSYEGLVIVASAEMTRQLRLAMDRRVFELMIAEILEDAPDSCEAASAWSAVS
jgi:protein required for attachment to host cells